MKQSTRKKIAIVGATFAAVVLWVTALILLGSTLINGLFAALPGLILALVTFPIAAKIYRRRHPQHPGWTDIIVRSLLYFAIVIPLGMSIMLALNKFPAPTEPVEVSAVVTSKYTREESQYRTVGRRRIYQGTRTVHYITVSLPDGHSKDYRVNPSTFNHYRKGSEVTMSIRRGFLGFDIIENSTVYSGKYKRKG